MAPKSFFSQGSGEIPFNRRGVQCSEQAMECGEDHRHGFGRWKAPFLNREKLPCGRKELA
jgi:hypothetical protein